MYTYSSIRIQALPINQDKFVYLGSMRTEPSDREKIEEAVKELAQILYEHKTLTLNLYDASGVSSVFRAEHFAAFRVIPEAD